MAKRKVLVIFCPDKKAVERVTELLAELQVTFPYPCLLWNESKLELESTDAFYQRMVELAESLKGKVEKSVRGYVG